MTSAVLLQESKEERHEKPLEKIGSIDLIQQREFMGVFFAKSAADHYFKHLPKDSSSRFQETVLDLFTADHDDLDLGEIREAFVAGLWEQGFKLKVVNEQLCYAPDRINGGFTLEINPVVVFDRLVSDGLSALTNPYAAEELSELYGQIENFQQLNIDNL
ncbi:hypothetical protein KY385_00785 [Candidatus Parcubacteria bacterium]|nr:hypothetical protein [Candidatus Parcubacteria bacterium]